MLQPVKKIDLRPLVESFGVVKPSLENKPNSAFNEANSDSAVSRDEDDLATQQQQNEANRVAAYDFVNRK